MQSPWRILVVDDNPDALDMLQALLETDGHEVLCAADGESALALVADGPPCDMALLDIGLPGMDGFKLARALRQLPSWDCTFLVALTGYGGDADVRAAHAAGFDRHMLKPAGRRLLQGLIADLRASDAASQPARERRRAAVWRP
ncbi:MAG TPA: response regulator [Candidatus Binatia bacterium]|nr:response regulator [Candidatus Binatia bacterium]